MEVEVWYGGVEEWYGGVEVWRCYYKDMQHDVFLHDNVCGIGTT